MPRTIEQQRRIDDHFLAANRQRTAKVESGERDIELFNRKLDFLLWAVGTQSQPNQTTFNGANAILQHAQLGQQLAARGRPQGMSEVAWLDFTEGLAGAIDLAERHIAAYQQLQAGGGQGSRPAPGFESTPNAASQGPNWFVLGGGVLVLAGAVYGGYRWWKARKR